ncbi:core-2/I-branching enzyme-domain-containing protein [Chytriomyces sp. MP71]|nr:core-2/I-branching enzyme-domain-containing protein [Chytriomyces sp. MP71]
MQLRHRQRLRHALVWTIVGLLLLLHQLLLASLSVRPHRRLQSPTVWPLAGLDRAGATNAIARDSEADLASVFSAPLRRNTSTASSSNAIATVIGPAIAYGILCHNQDTASGAMDLINSLYLPTDLFVIHVDAKAGLELIKKLHQFYSSVSNVVVLDRSYNSEWGQVELMGAEVALLDRALLLEKEFPWDLFLLLDGSAIPLQSLQTIKAKLTPVLQNQWNSVYDSRTGTHSSTCTFWNSLFNRRDCGFHRGYCIDLACKQFVKTPGGNPVYKGTEWIILTKAFAKHVLQVSEGWLDFFGGSFASDEMFFPSILESVSDQFKGSDIVFNYMFKETRNGPWFKKLRKRGFYLHGNLKVESP